jgi:hypothetical protein
MPVKEWKTRINSLWLVHTFNHSQESRLCVVSSSTDQGWTPCNLVALTASQVLFWRPALAG